MLLEDAAHLDSRPHVNIVVLHSDPLTSAGLAFACARDKELRVQEAPTFAPSLKLSADVVVADYSSGLSLAGEAKVVIVGGSGREWDIRRALERGVHGYLLAGCTPDEVVTAIHSVARGVRHLSPQAAARLADSVCFEPLTRREEEVLRLVADGLPNKAIASRLGITAGTVKSHLKSTFGKLNVQSRTQAVALVQQRGLLGVG